MLMANRILSTDQAKYVPKLHRADAEGNVLVRKTLTPAGLLHFLAGLPSRLIGVRAVLVRIAGRETGNFVRASGHAPRLEVPETWPPPKRPSRHQISTVGAGASRPYKA
jgi:hypothetical protein